MEKYDEEQERKDLAKARRVFSIGCTVMAILLGIAIGVLIALQ